MITQLLQRFTSKKRIFLDYASATPTNDEVMKVYSKYSQQFYNPASVYREGIESKKLMLDARTRIAHVFGGHHEEVLFTSGGTESANLAIRGVFAAAKVQGMSRPHIVVSAFEHVCVLETAQALEAEGALVTVVHPTEEGIITPASIAATLTPDTVLVLVMHANNEIGTIQPLRLIAKEIKSYRRTQGRDEHCAYPYLCSDICQSVLYEETKMPQLGADILIADGLKLYGPRPAGVLIVKRAVDIMPLMTGGAHQRALRPGTENVALAQAMAVALEKAVSLRTIESERLHSIQRYCVDRLQQIFSEKILFNGSLAREHRLPNNVNVCIKGKDSEFMVIQLDHAGIACSSASSCATLKDSGGSYVIATLGSSRNHCVDSSLRFSFGRTTTKSDIDLLVAEMRSLV